MSKYSINLRFGAFGEAILFRDGEELTRFEVGIKTKPSHIYKKVISYLVEEEGVEDTYPLYVNGTKGQIRHISRTYRGSKTREVSNKYIPAIRMETYRRGREVIDLLMDSLGVSYSCIMATINYNLPTPIHRLKDIYNVLGLDINRDWDVSDKFENITRDNFKELVPMYTYCMGISIKSIAEEVGIKEATARFWINNARGVKPSESQASEFNVVIVNRLEDLIRI